MQEVLTIGDEKQARREGSANLRELGGEEIAVYDSITVELIGPNIDVQIGGQQATDGLDLGDEVHTPKPTHNRTKVAASVRFTAPGATQVVVFVAYIQSYAGDLEVLFAEEQTATAKDSIEDGHYHADPLDFNVRGATLYEIRRKAPSSGATAIRAWPY